MKQEDKTMFYIKPEVVKLADALDAIQGQTFKSVAPADNMPSNTVSTVSAYEADE